MVTKEDFHYHMTRITNLKVQEYYKYSQESYLNINGMIWDQDIFLDNFEKMKKLKEQGDFTLFELEYYDYRLFFIVEIQSNYPYHKNVFWVNILKLGTYYQSKKNESIITFKVSGYNQGRIINQNNKSYTAVHVGNALNRYCDICNMELSSKAEAYFWQDVNDYFSGTKNELTFYSSVIGDYMIVYAVKSNK